MAKTPTGTVECRDPKVCGGVRFHYATTTAACGATAKTIHSAAVLHGAPPQQRAVIDCPLHGIETEEGEYDVSEFKSAAALAVGAALLLCSCTGTPDPDPTPAPTIGIEHTANPSPSADASPNAEAFDIWEASPSDWLAYEDGYEFSDTPQGPAEQWLFDTYPDLWDQGIRVVTYNNWTMHPVRGEGSIPGALVQYIGGERAEGTEDIPLRFRGQVDDINEFPTDVFPNMMASLKNPSGTTPPGKSLGEGGYRVSIREHYHDTRGEVVNTSMTIAPVEQDIEAGSDGSSGGQRNFDTWEDAWEFLQTQGFQPNSPGARKLYPGEIAYVYVVQENANSQDSALLNPETGEWEIVKSRKHPN